MPAHRASSGVKSEVQSVPLTQQPYFAHHQPVPFMEVPRMNGAPVAPVNRENGSVNNTHMSSTLSREQLNSSASYLHERQLTEAKHEFSPADQPTNMLLPGLRRDSMPVPPARGGSKKPTTDGDVKRKGAATALAQKIKAQEQDRFIEAAQRKFCL